MNRRQWIMSGVAVTVLAGMSGCWLTRKKPMPVSSPVPAAPPPPVPPPPSPVPEKKVEPKKEIPKPKDGEVEEPKPEPKKPEKKTSIRETLPKDAMAVETLDGAIARGTGLTWRKKKLEAVVTPDKWRAVQALTDFGFGARAGATIVLSDEVLRAHVGERPLASGPVVVAVRGARPGGAYNGFSSSQTLTVTPPDHLNFCCTIAVWDPETKLVSAYAGSTVPNRTAIVSSALGIQNANMRLPGIADYVPGSHSNYKDYGFPFSIPGALRQNGAGGGAGALPVLRATSPLGMAGARQGSTTDDNLHCAETPLLEPYDRFSSEGCLVVAGRYTPSEGHTGPWAAFLGDAKMKGRAAVTLILVNSTDLA